MPELNQNIFNTNKTDYNVPSLFLGEPMGLFDSMNRHFPKIFDLYKQMKDQDWDENEFSFTSCYNEFRTCDPFTAELMINNLIWQWETDSVAARTIYAVTAPYITSNELNALYQEIGKNETLHALTYSEIVRFSFEETPEYVLNKVLSNQESFKRLEIASDIFNTAYIVGHQLALGILNRNDIEVYEAIFMFIVAMYCLERIQFMASFGVTFTIANTGQFVPIGTAIQKICLDELLHAKSARTVLDYELSTERGLLTFNRLKGKINKLIDAIVQSEINWTRNCLFKSGNEAVGLNADQICKWVYYNAEEVYKFFGCKPLIDIHFPDSNPLWFLENWINANNSQKSPQEEKTGLYLLGGITYDDETKKYDIQGLN